MSVKIRRVNKKKTIDAYVFNWDTKNNIKLFYENTQRIRKEGRTEGRKEGMEGRKEEMKEGRRNGKGRRRV